jgi:hypothetical protein
MLIGSISSIAPIASPFNQALTAPIPPLSWKSTAAAPASAPEGVQASSSSTAPAPAPTSTARVAPTAPAPNASALDDELITGYSTTVGKTQYSGAVDESGGTYTASASNLLGATANGTTILMAEINLNTRIDELA